MLRKHDWLVKALKLDNKSLITSSTAARINGYVGGYGDEVRTWDITRPECSVAAKDWCFLGFNDIIITSWMKLKGKTD